MDQDLRAQWLAEAGIVRWRLRPAQPAQGVGVTALTAAAERAGQSTARRAPVGVVGVSPGPPAAALSVSGAYGAHTVRFQGAPGWPQLRRHVLQALSASAVDSVEAEVVFGGKGAGLSFPALGALAATPALKRQVWTAWRAWRRAHSA